MTKASWVVLEGQIETVATRVKQERRERQKPFLESDAPPLRRPARGMRRRPRETETDASSLDAQEKRRRGIFASRRDKKPWER